MTSNCRHFKQTHAYNITIKGQNVTERVAIRNTVYVVALCGSYNEITIISKAMAEASGRSNVWMIDRMEYYLTKDLEATSEEIEYLKTLCALKSKPRDPAIKLQGLRKPSAIIDMTFYTMEIWVMHKMRLYLMNWAFNIL